MSALATLLADALAHHKAGRLADAEAAYRQAEALAPARAAITQNLAAVLAARGDHVSALDCFDRVIASEPGYAAAHYNRAIALYALDRPKEAIKGFSRAVAIEPEHYDAHRALGFLWLAQGDRGRALDHFARTNELRRGEDRSGIAARSLIMSSRQKLAHDAAQFRYLATRRRDGKRFEMLARTYESVAADLPDGGISALSAEHHESLGEDYNTAIHVWSAPEVAGGAVNPQLDANDIVERYASGHGATWFDDFLSPAALAGLRRFLLESTIWHDFDHIGGFVASYLEDGLACPLILQIADEMRQRFPALLSQHPLTQAWAFKGLEGSAAVDAHADAAAVSLNFWMTPDAANMEPEAGGLRVCRTPPPPDWRITGYDHDAAAVAAFLDAHNDDTLAVPYGCNRAVLFDSRLFHLSDAPRFVSTYEGHRINVTLLFGHHGS